MKLQTMIIDDEAAARSRLRRLLQPHPQIEVIGEAADGLEAIEQVMVLSPDLLFLDIQMPGLSGFDVLDAIPAESRSLVIFTTAYEEYALQAFDAFALGYLLKPVDRQDLARCIHRAHALLGNPEEQERESSAITECSTEAFGPPHHVVCRQGSVFKLLSLDDVLSFESIRGRVHARTRDRVLGTDYSLGTLEQRLSESFFRARREVLVHLKHIDEIRCDSRSTYVLRLRDQEGTEVRVSERQAKSLRERLNL